MIKKSKTTDVFEAEDGKEFLTAEECEHYEKEVLALMKKIKYYSAVCNPDLTEGRGYYTSVYIAVLGNDYVSLQRALKLMIDTYGSPIAYVQGCAPMTNWSVPSVCTKEAFDMAMPTKVGDYHGRVQKIFISQTKVPGMPDPIWVE